jgi:hypothetical protein
MMITMVYDAAVPGHEFIQDRLRTKKLGCTMSWANVWKLFSHALQILDSLFILDLHTFDFSFM